MDPRSEAQAWLPDDHEARVLEPSPPAVAEGPWFADDPVARGAGAAAVVSPVSTGDETWTQLAAADPALADFCRPRWLGPYPALAGVPGGYAQTRAALHAVAERIVAPARQRATTKLGLRYTRGGFGTPFFGDDVQVRVASGVLHVVRAGTDAAAPLTTLAAAAEHLGPDLLDPVDDDRTLVIEDTAARLVGDWFGFAFSVLEELRATADAALVPSRVQIWPEHFDAALELGDEAAGRRAAYGCSPGDEAHAEPYVYVAPWTAPPEGALWQSEAFSGAELGYAELLAAADPRELALAFFRERVEALRG